MNRMTADAMTLNFFKNTDTPILHTFCIWSTSAMTLNSFLLGQMKPNTQAL